MLRNELDRNTWSDIDGETLLSMDKEDFVEKGIKPYHLKKLQRVLDLLRAEAANGETQPDESRHGFRDAPRPAEIIAPNTSAPTNSGMQQASSPSNLRRRVSYLADEANELPRQESPRRRRTGSDGASSSTRDIAFDWTKADLLGQGAFGKVFLGLDNVSGAFLAVKEITFMRENKKELEELKTEIRLLRQLNIDTLCDILAPRYCCGK